MTNDKVIELCRKHGWTVCTETTDIYMMGPVTRFDVKLRDEQGRLLVQDEVREPFASEFINRVLLPLARCGEYIPSVSEEDEPAANTIARICRETLDDIDDASDRDYEDARGLVVVNCECMLNALHHLEYPESLEEPDLFASGLSESLDNIAWGVRQMLKTLPKRHGAMIQTPKGRTTFGDGMDPVPQVSDTQGCDDAMVQMREAVSC